LTFFDFFWIARQSPFLAYCAIIFSSGIQLKQKLYIYKSLAELHNDLKKSQKNSLQIETIGTYPTQGDKRAFRG